MVSHDCTKDSDFFSYNLAVLSPLQRPLARPPAVYGEEILMLGIAQSSNERRKAIHSGESLSC